MSASRCEIVRGTPCAEPATLFIRVSGEAYGYAACERHRNMLRAEPGMRVTVLRAL